MDYSDIKGKIKSLEVKVRRNKDFIEACKGKDTIREISFLSCYVNLNVKHMAELAEKQNKLFLSDIEKLREVDKQMETISGALMLQQFGVQDGDA